MNKPINIAFFGTPDRAVYVLDELKRANLTPNLIVTQPDRPQGRNLVITPPPVKLWAQTEGVEALQPNDLDDPTFIKKLKARKFDVFVVVAYGKILKQTLLDIPKAGSLNLHASLLPLLRGSCPIETAILSNAKETGVTIIRMDEKMDHGPIVIQKKIMCPKWPLPADDLAYALVREGGKLFAEILPEYVKGNVKLTNQDHSRATYTKKIVKEDGLISLSDDPYKNYLKWNAYKGWPGTFFFADIKGKKTRIVITEAVFENDQFVIKKVIPEGKKEVLWSEIAKTVQ